MFARTRLLALSSTALVVALTAVGASPAAAVVIPTPVTKALPVALDVKTPYQAQTSCDPRPKPGVTAFNALMKARYNSAGVGLYRPCLGDTSEHYDGRATDWMLNVRDPRQKAIADSVTAWLSARGGVMARRFGISYVIWNKKVWKEYRPEAGWTAYSGSSPHTDHIHISFSWDGAMGRTSWWTGRATTVVDRGPCRVYAGEFAPLYRSARTVACPTSLPAAPVSPYRVAVFGQTSPQIAVAQKRLGVAVTGKFGSPTFVKLVAWQRLARVPITGVLDKASWAKLFRTVTPPSVTPAQPPRLVPTPVRSAASLSRYTPYKSVVLGLGTRGAAVSFLQAALRVRPDGTFGISTRVAVLAFQARSRLPLSGVVGLKMWNRLELRDYPLAAYHSLTLRQGASGAAVVAVQRRLGLTADGDFGPITAAAVRVVQGRAQLAPTGVVSGPTWIAIGTWVLR